MSRLLIKGGRKLEGRIRISGNKNSALKLIAASLLTDKKVILENVPVIRDVQVMGEIIKKLGVKIAGENTDTWTIDSSNISSYKLDPELTEKIRASVVLAAPLLTKFGKAIITPPGGDQIGERLLDTHFMMMKNFGVEVKKINGKYYLEWKKRKSTKVFLEEASVTATEMALIMAAGSSNSVQIKDAACEPHVEDLANMISKMGKNITGAGTNTINISGSSKLNSVRHKVIPDHIIGGTYMIASAITGGNVIIEDFVPEHYEMILSYLSKMGVKTKVLNGNEIEMLPSKLVATQRKFQTRPWPGFPTDLMSPFIVLATQTKGMVLCHDWMYEWRIFFVDDLISMGANIFIADPHRVIISGRTKLNADNLFCKDIRAGISVILAALVAKGESMVSNVEMVERGYENIQENFSSLGAEIKRIP